MSHGGEPPPGDAPSTPGAPGAPTSTTVAGGPLDAAGPTDAAAPSHAAGPAHRAAPAPLTSLAARPYLYLVSAVVAWNLWSTRANLRPVTYLYDNSVHEEMTRFATKTIAAGHLPFSSWFPYLGLGSAQYLHYQSLASVLTGLAGTAVGAGTAFRWSLYLLVGLWPFAIYSSARVWGLARAAATMAALLSPFVVSFTGIGLERGAYSWAGGAGVWTQLFGSWALPYAWAFAWRALADARFVWVASAFGGLTIALHFLCGYLALLGIAVVALAGPGRVLGRLARGAMVFAGSLAAAAWALVPLMLLAKWSAVNQALAETPYVRGYGARQELKWLFTGQIFDARRTLPVISVAVLLGVALAVARWRADPLTRVLLVLAGACLMLSFGPTTWGAVADLVPAHADLYFRRFSMGTQLAGTYLAGTGVMAVWGAWRWLVRTFSTTRRAMVVASACFAAGTLAWFSPAVDEIVRYDQSEAATIASQRQADAAEGADLAPLVDYVKSHGDGRAYAGLSSNWGQHFLVGYVPVYKYLVSQDVDEMAYVVPSLSLMVDAEANFNENDPADYALFGTRYIFLPAGTAPPVPAQEVMTRGSYALWQVPATGYVELVRTVGTLAADRADVGSRSADLLATLAPHEDLSVRFPGAAAPPPPEMPGFAGVDGPPSPGVVDSVEPRLASGTLSTEVDMARAGTLLLSVSYDPGWHAWVDGRRAPTEMLAPALTGVQLAPGRHQVEFRYAGFGWYPELWAGSFISLAGLFVWGRRRHRYE